MIRASLLCLVAVFAISCAANDDVDQLKAVRMKTTRQLREIFKELDIDAPASLSKEELQALALKENAVSRWEELHPEKKRKPRGPGPGGFAFGGDAPEGIEPEAWAKLKAQMNGDFSYEKDPEKARILKKLKSMGVSFGGASDMDIEQLRNLEQAMAGMKDGSGFRTPGGGAGASEPEEIEKQEL